MTQVRTRSNSATSNVATSSRPKGVLGINNVSSATYTLVGDDHLKHVIFSVACTITVPAGLDDLFQCVVVNDSSGTVTMVAASGVTIRAEGLNLATQYTAAEVTHRGSNLFSLLGKLT